MGPQSASGTTLIVAHLRQQVSSEASDTPRKLPQAEKTARYADLKARLKGLVIEDELLPSRALVDAISHMADSNHLTWLPPSRCTKRDTELKVAKKKTKFLKCFTMQ